MANYLSDRTGAQIDAAMDTADAALPKAGGTLTGNVTSSTGKSLNTVLDTADAALPKAGGTLTGDVTSSTGKSLNTVLDNADAGNIGKSDGGSVDDWNLASKNTFIAASTNAPVSPGNMYGVHIQSTDPLYAAQFLARNQRFWGRTKEAGTWSQQEFYHTGNTGSAVFDTIPDGTKSEIALSSNAPYTISYVSTLSGLSSMCRFINANGQVGSIQTSGTATSFNTASDPRLKDFKDAPTDSAINDKFDDLFGCFKTFNWKNDSDGELVWGFDAHATIDAGLDLGSEGEGPRELNLGDVYETTPAVFEDKEQPVVYKTGEKKGEQKLYADGEPVMETVQVEVTAAIEKKVSPAGVDQSKAVPILLAKIEQLERRLTAAGL